MSGVHLAYYNWMNTTTTRRQNCLIILLLKGVALLPLFRRVIHNEFREAEESPISPHGSADDNHSIHPSRERS